MAATRHCWNCGTDYQSSRAPGRLECCIGCNSDLRVCLNCISYDARAAEKCKDRRADLVSDKHLANYCEFFELARREYRSVTENQGREESARDMLKKLLGD